MDWTHHILASAFFLALYDLAKKASVRGNAVLPTLLCSTAFGSAAFLLGLALCGALSAAITFSPLVLAISAVKSLIIATSWIFTFCALRTLPISIATPIRASAPALVFCVAFVVYGEVPTVVQACGMMLVFAGYFAFSWAGRHEGIDFFRNRAVWCAFAGMVFSAGSSLWDKYLFQVLALQVEQVQVWFQIFLFVIYAIFLGLVLCFRSVHRALTRSGGAQVVIGRKFEWRWSIPLIGMFLAAADWFYFTGLAFPEVPISVAALMRRVSVVVTFLLGAKVFHETNLLRKSAALAIILAGVALLCL